MCSYFNHYSYTQKGGHIMKRTIQILLVIAAALSVAAAGLAVAVGVLDVVKKSRSISCYEPDADPFRE